MHIGLKEHSYNILQNGSEKNLYTQKTLSFTKIVQTIMTKIIRNLGVNTTKDV